MEALHLCISPKETGENIRKLIRESGYSVRDIQDFLGFSSPRAIYKWMEGKSVPSIDSLLILSRVLGTSMEDILVIKEGSELMQSKRQDGKPIMNVNG